MCFRFPSRVQKGTANRENERQPFSYQLMLPSFNFPGNEIVFRDQFEGLSILNVETSEKTQIVSNTTFVSDFFLNLLLPIFHQIFVFQRRFNVIKYSLSPNRKFLLLVSNIKKVKQIPKERSQKNHFLILFFNISRDIDTLHLLNTLSTKSQQGKSTSSKIRTSLIELGTQDRW